jgi:hypothetical protein
MVVINDRAAGESIAAPTPCPTRVASSVDAELASAAASDAPVKTSRPDTKIRRRPSRSAARPPSSSRPPNASVYAVMTHCRSPIPKWRSAWIVGSATFTTVMSRITMNCARQRTMSAAMVID